MRESNLILYQTDDGKAAVSLYARDGSVWMNQSQLAELFATSVPNISMHISNVLKENELQENSVVENYLTTAAEVSEKLKALDKEMAENDKTSVGFCKELEIEPPF